MSRGPLITWHRNRRYVTQLVRLPLGGAAYERLQVLPIEREPTISRNRDREPKPSRHYSAGLRLRPRERLPVPHAGPR